jgi:hypothetical protein
LLYTGTFWEPGFNIIDVTDPTAPRLARYVHRSFYGGGRYVFATGLPFGYQGHILQIVDIGDPANPVEVSRWWDEGQWRAGGEPPAARGIAFFRVGVQVTVLR